jgi:hypothetical protein
MSGRHASSVTAAAMAVAAFLLLAPPVRAGGGPAYHAPPAPPVPLRPAVTLVPITHLVSRPVSVVVTVEPAPRAAAAPHYVDLRGPDGRVRRFPVEGGPAAIQAPSTVVLRPGNSVTLHFVATR